MQDRREMVTHVINAALSHIRRKYMWPSDWQNQLDFHDADHSKGVLDRASTIYWAAFAPNNIVTTLQQGFDLVALASASHDLDQEWEAGEEVDEFGTWTVRRAVPGREKRSFERFQAIVAANKNYLFKREIPIIEQAIMATAVSYDPHGTLVQPSLTQSSPLEAQVVAMADLSYPGMVGGDGYLRAGDALFREQNLGIRGLISGEVPLQPEQLAAIANRIRAWSQEQVLYVQKRRKGWLRELTYLPADKQSVVASLFKHWDTAEDVAQRTAQARQTMSDKDVIRDIGYRLS